MRRATRVIVAGVAVAALATAGLAAHEYQAVADVKTKGPKRFPTSTPVVRLAVSNASNLQRVRVLLDGRDVSQVVRVESDAVVLSDIPLRDGWHKVRLRADQDNWFGGRIDRRFSLLVDTRKPRLDLDQPGGYRTDSTFAGVTERGATLTVSWSGGRIQTVADGPRFRLRPDLPDGPATLRIAARDAAGNRTVRWRRIVIDPDAPAVKIAAPSAVLKSRNPTLRGVVHDRSPVKVRASFDGTSAKVETRPGGRGAWKLPMHELAEGLHVLTLDVTDPAGNTTTTTREFAVDSTEKLRDDMTLRIGARGADVKQLQRRLKKEGHFEGPLSRFYNQRTAEAVRRFQLANAMEPDGIAGPAVIAATSGRIKVDLSEFRMWLVKDGKIVFSAPIATGTSQYPTPTGRWAITSMIRNPTWIPPNSPWAAGLEAIPPGAANPLGSRWIGTSAPNIGFHATNAPSTVGRAASHGCMRMYQADVERLFELVKVGMPVDIQA